MIRDKDIIFIERIPKKLMSTTYSHRMTYVLLLWLLRVFYTSCIYLIIEEIFIGSYNIPYIGLVVLALGAAILIFYAEFVTTSDIKAATSIIIFSNRIKVYRNTADILHGVKKELLRKDIEKIFVIRGTMTQDLTFSNYITWKNAPGGLIIYLNNNTIYKTGLKYPPQIDMMIRFFREQWGIPIIDKGEGVGEIYERNSNHRLEIQAVMFDAYR